MFSNNNNKDKKQGIKIRKDRIFIFVLVITAGTVIWHFMSSIYGMFINSGWMHFRIWMYLIADGLAFWGVIFLLRGYRRTLKAQKKELEKKQNEN